MIIASKSRSAIDKLKKDLSSKFEMKDLGEVKKVLDMEIERDWKSGKISLKQKEYLKKVPKKFNINNDIVCKCVIGSSFQFKSYYISYYC